MTAPAQVAGPTRAGAGYRPAWRIRGFAGKQEDTNVVLLRLPAGFAATPEEALEKARQRFPLTMKTLKADRWRAFPVTDAEAEAL